MIMREYWNHDKYKHLNDALKKSRDDLGDTIVNYTIPFFETTPINYGTTKKVEEKCDSPHGFVNHWHVIASQILDPQKALYDLKKALDKIEEISEYEK